MDLHDLLPAFLEELEKIANVVLEQNIQGNTTSKIDKCPHGFEGRLTKTPAVKLKTKKIEGPRAYAPRI